MPFTTDGRLDIDNGSAERYLRLVASDRKAWLFAGSEGGAKRFADQLSLVSTELAAGVDPGTSPRCCRGLDGWPHARIAELMPHLWAIGGDSDEQAAQ